MAKSNTTAANTAPRSNKGNKGSEVATPAKALLPTVAPVEVPATVAPVAPVEAPKSEAAPAAKRKLSENAIASRATNDGKAYPSDWVITQVNPTKYSKGRLARFELHAVGQSVGAYLAKAKEKAQWSHASSQADLRWDVAKGHIVIEAPKAS